MSPRLEITLLIVGAIPAAAVLAMLCAIFGGVIRPATRARANRKRLAALKTNRKPWPAALAWLHL